jgi:hypothetical protein
VLIGGQDLFAWPDQALEDIESSLSTQQYIQQFVRSNPADVAAMVTLPEGTDEKVWQYEHVRCAEQAASLRFFLFIRA